MAKKGLFYPQISLKSLNYKLYNKNNQAGMTLIELTVVLLVLIGLAGLLIPYVTGFTQKTHDSTGTNNLAALNGNFARFQNEYMRDPDNLESLIQINAYTGTTNPDCNGTAANTIYCKMMTTTFWTPTALTGPMAVSYTHLTLPTNYLV